jgi:DNA-binding PadR family transcriptional regulator
MRDYSCKSTRVSSIRLFILGALADGGETHGHQLRQLAEQERVHLWTDISVGGLYGALKRLGAEGLIEEVRTEQVGGYPERQIWAITAAGRIALARLRDQGLREVVLRADPFDLALARLDRDRLDEVPGVLAARLAELRAMLADAELHARSAAPYITPLETRVISHKSARLEAEIAWHEALLAAMPDLLADEASRKDRPRD